MLVACVICGEKFEKHRNVKTCSKECRRKLKVATQVKYRSKQDSEPKFEPTFEPTETKFEPTEEELKKEFPYFYEKCFPISYNKTALHKCLKCGRVVNIRNNNRICCFCTDKNKVYGALACPI